VVPVTSDLRAERPFGGGDGSGEAHVPVAGAHAGDAQAGRPEIRLYGADRGSGRAEPRAVLRRSQETVVAVASPRRHRHRGPAHGGEATARGQVDAPTDLRGLRRGTEPVCTRGPERLRVRDFPRRLGRPCAACQHRDRQRGKRADDRCGNTAFLHPFPPVK
jgi:hypothetical protein